MLRRGCLASRLDAETRVLDPRALVLRRGCLASCLGVETRPILTLRLELEILLFNGLSFSDFF